MNCFLAHFPKKGMRLFTRTLCSSTRPLTQKFSDLVEQSLKMCAMISIPFGALDTLQNYQILYTLSIPITIYIFTMFERIVLKGLHQAWGKAPFCKLIDRSITNLVTKGGHEA